MKYYRKKNVLVMLSASLLVLSLAACESEQPPEIAASVTETTVPATVSTEAPTEPAFDFSGTMEKTLLYDDHNFTVTATELRYEENQAVFCFRMENTGMEPLLIKSTQAGAPVVTVNDLFIPNAPEQWEIPVGYYVDGEYVFPYETLKEYGISAISRIQFELYSDSFTTGVMTVQTEAPFISFQEQLQSHAQELGWTVKELKEESGYASGGVNHVLTALVQDGEDQEILFLGFENTTDKVLVLDAVSSELNGLTVPTFYGDMALMPKTMGIIRVNLTREQEENILGALGMDKIGSFRLNLKLYDGSRKMLGEPGCLETVLDESVPMYAHQGEPVWDADGLSAVSLGCHDLPSDPQMTGLYLVWSNASKETIGATPCNLKIGGTSISCSADNVTVEPGSYVLSYVAVSKMDLEEAGLTASGTWEMSLMTRVKNEKKLQDGFMVQVP